MIKIDVKSQNDKYLEMEEVYDSGRERGKLRTTNQG
jgi:hypothetical protein